MWRMVARFGLASLAIVCLLAPGCAHRGKTAQGQAALRVGTPITVQQPIVIAELSRTPESLLGQTVRLEGTVSRVCQGMGCWLEVKAPDGSTFLARSMDESVLVPTDCAGRRVVVQGVVTALPAKAAEEPNPEGHECPRPQYLVSTQGVELR